MQVWFSLFPSLIICLVFFVLSYIDICYFMQESIELVVLEEHKSEVVVNPPLPPLQVHVCFTFFENIICRPCSIYVSNSFYYLKLTYVTLCRLLVRHRCLKRTKLVTHLWRDSRYVYLSLSLYVCVSLSLIWYLKRPKLVTHLFPPNVHVYLLTLAYIFFMQLDSEQVVLEEHPIRVTVSEAPGFVITYSRTVTRNVIFLWRNLNKCIYIIFKGW